MMCIHKECMPYTRDQFLKYLGGAEYFEMKKGFHLNSLCLLFKYTSLKILLY